MEEHVNKKRQIIYDKSKGHCWYCGCSLEEGWHADHLVPIRRYKGIRITDEGVEHFTACENPELDNLDNTVPACRSCNLFKGVYSVEDFRKQLEVQVERARLYSVNFRTAERFGLVQTTNKPIVFWFEERL